MNCSPHDPRNFAALSGWHVSGMTEVSAVFRGAQGERTMTWFAGISLRNRSFTVANKLYLYSVI
jgi:hypothetical protein